MPMQSVMNIKGKDYMMVHGRLQIFRTDKKYQGMSLVTELIHLEGDSCVMKATIHDADGTIVATGFAQEDRTSSYINKTSYIENCETSAWGRALANLGIGLDVSVASADEVSMAIAKQDFEKESGANVFDKALAYVKEGKNKPQRKERFDKIVSKYGSELADQIEDLKSAI